MTRFILLPNLQFGQGRAGWGQLNSALLSVRLEGWAWNHVKALTGFPFNIGSFLSFLFYLVWLLVMATEFYQIPIQYHHLYIFWSWILIPYFNIPEVHTFYIFNRNYLWISLFLQYFSKWSFQIFHLFFIQLW